jgi:hypothetical protein
LKERSDPLSGGPPWCDIGGKITYGRLQKRRRKAGVPEEVEFKTKPQIAHPAQEKSASVTLTLIA